MWQFHTQRLAAINHLGTLSDAEKIVLARRYDIEEWMLPTLLKLAQRPEPISMEEARLIGFETALKLSAVREKVQLGCGRTYHRDCRECGWQGQCIPRDGHLVVGDRDPATQYLNFTPLLQTAFDL